MTEKFINNVVANIDTTVTVPTGTETVGDKAIDIFVKDWSAVKSGLEVLKLIIGNHPIAEEIVTLVEMIGDKVDERLIAKESTETAE